MMKFFKITYAFVAMLLIASCGQTEVVEADHGHQQHASEIIQANDLKTGEIKREVLSQSLLVPARIEAPPQSTAQIYPTVGAFVREVYVIKGSKVQKGDRLVSLYHPDLLDLQERYLSASVRLEQNEQDYERKQSLLTENATSLREVQQAKADYLASKSEVSSLGSILRGMGLDLEKIRDGQLSETVYLLAPIDGHILETRAGVGQFAGSDAPLFVLVNRRHLHLEMQVPPAYIDRIRPGNPVQFTARTSDKLCKGEVYLVNAVADESGFFNVHAHFDDEVGNLHPGTFAEARIIYTSDTVYALPQTAVFTEEGIARVLSIEDDEFREITVTTGWSAEDYVSILDHEQLLGKQLVLNRVKYLLSDTEELGHSH